MQTTCACCAGTSGDQGLRSVFDSCQAERCPAVAGPGAASRAGILNFYDVRARACGMDTAARTAAAEIPTKILEARFIEFMEIPPLQERNRDKEDFAKEGIRPDLLDMMKQYGTLEHGKWNVQEIFEYRYETNKAEGLFACLARLRGNLFVTGLIASDAKVIEGEDMPADWIKPPDLLTILTDARFEKKL